MSLADINQLIGSKKNEVVILRSTVIKWCDKLIPLHHRIVHEEP